MNTLRRVVLAAWVLFFAVVALFFAFPKPMSRILHPVTPYFVLLPIFVLVLSAFYGVLRVYRLGMKR
jgi:hypothetical protein